MLANVHLAVTNLIRYVPGQVISNDKQMVSVHYLHLYLPQHYCITYLHYLPLYIPHHYTLCALLTFVFISALLHYLPALLTFVFTSSL